MVTATLYLLHYNNYYNRVVKKEDTISGYQEYLIGENPIQGVNFIPNDYVDTQQIVNWPEGLTNPDYLVVVDEDQNINSRWFIISTTRTRAGQLQLDLHRDLVVDFYDPIIQAPCFIEKAIPKSIRDPAIYNSEDMTFNQIKQKEQLLYDETKCPWVVGYIPRDAFQKDGEGNPVVSTPININAQITGAVYDESTNMSDFWFWQYRDKIINVDPSRIKYQIGLHSQGPGTQSGSFYDNVITVDSSGNFIGYTESEAGSWGRYGSGYTGDYNVVISPGSIRVGESSARAIVSNYPSIASSLKNPDSSYLDNPLTDAQLELLKPYVGKIIKETQTGIYYKVELETSPSGTNVKNINPTSGLGGSMWDTLKKSDIGSSGTSSLSIDSTQSPNESTFKIIAENAEIVLRINPLSVKIQTSIPSTRYQVAESPYDMFCMPYSDELTIYKNGNIYIQKTSKDAALSIAQQISAELGKDNIYDIQLLPYCPVRYLLKADESVDIGDAIYSPIINTEATEGSQPLSVLLWVRNDHDSFQIDVSIPEIQNVVEKKVDNETSFIRFVSPNFSNSFEFKPQMNNGLDYVTVTFQYKPFNPYIKIQPNFGGLYGGSAFNDARGLICGGDYSLAQITSAWADYELQNKNYQLMFNREIQNMEVNNAVQRTREKWNIAAGTIGASVQGASAGMMVAGPYGALAGIGTGAASLAGGIADYTLNEKLRTEALDYKNDMFGYQLQNIQALPYGLAKVSAIAPDNKYVPFIEYYSCDVPGDQTMKDALRNKIKYNGCTIMMIGSIADYRGEEISYIKGRLIRTEDIQEDYHILNAIAGELYKGVFI